MMNSIAKLMKKTRKLPKLLVIAGPTASGKTDLAVELARLFSGELIAADSRTIYKGMDIGTGKDLSHPHKLMDVVRPDQVMTLAEYKAKAVRAIRSAARKGKLPILVGGTGLYIWAVVDNLLIPKVPPNPKMREEMEKKPIADLVNLLVSIDPAAAKTAGKNKRRIIRALEVMAYSGERFSHATRKGKPLFDCMEIGILLPREKLIERIDARVDAMMKAGLMDEVMALRKKLYAPSLPSMSGIGYAELNAVLDGRMSPEAAVERIKARTRQYARRQMTWFRRDPRIKWVKDAEEAIGVVKKWLV
jgi:tRNA dimethylallyltransferase